MSFDPSEDFELVVDGLEAVTLSVTGEADQAITKAHRTAIDYGEADEAGGDVRQDVIRWEWAVAQTTTRPPLGSVITDGDGVAWTILELAKEVELSKWSAVCRNLAVEESADTLITIQRAAYSKDATYGTAVAAWSNTYLNVRAKIQPLDYEAEVEWSADRVELHYAIFLKDEAVVYLAEAEYRVIDAEGDCYSILRYERPEMLGELPRLIGKKTVEDSSSSGA